MAFDGITIANIVKECNDSLIGGRIYKIAQPENDELLLTIKANKEQYRILISADASLPLFYFTDNNKVSPLTAPNFCMLLRKHIQNARIVAITQPELERIIRIEVEHLNELGDLCTKYVIVELMGKHSNIIFCKEDNTIIDSIKHISGMVSSVREVLPGRTYFVPNTMEKVNPLESDGQTFQEVLQKKSLPLFKAIYGNFTGISPVIANEICYLAKVEANKPTNSLDQNEFTRLYESFERVMNCCKKGEFVPNIIYENGVPKEYASIELSSYCEDTVRKFSSISQLLEQFYKEKNEITRIRQKSVDLRKIVQTLLERNYRKLDLQNKQLKDTEKKEQYKIYGELLNTYGYSAKLGDKYLETLNYYTNESIRIPLDPQLSALENAKKYFDKYGKLKRTLEALSIHIKETQDEIEHLESISNSLDIALVENDLVQIKEELIVSGYSKKKGNTKKEKITSKPFHYVSSDGYHMYVGKNNFQNEELTFQIAQGNDWWFHAKNVPGSHVIVKSNGEMLPDRTFEEAGRLAAFYSKVRNNEKVEVDYTQKKNIKKPSGGKPGFVVYYTNYSLIVAPDISDIQQQP